MSNWEIIGLIASIFTAVQLIPEVVKALKNKHLNDIAWGMLFLVVIGQVLWLIYGIHFKLLPIILGAIVHGVMGLFLAYLKTKYQRLSLGNPKTEYQFKPRKAIPVMHRIVIEEK